MRTSTAILVFRWCLSFGVTLLASSPVFAAMANVGGTLKSVSASGKTITVTVGTGSSAKTESFGVTAGTKVTLDDKPAKLSDLKPGSKVSISYDKGSKDAASIKAHSAMADRPQSESSAAPAKAATNSKDAPPPAWTMDLAKMHIPDAAVTGKIHGQPFKLEKVGLQGNVLELRQGRDFFPDLSLKVFLKLKADESVEGKTIRVTSKDGFSSPQIHLQYRAKPGEGLPETEFVTEGYAMILQFGKAADGVLPAKIFVSLPDKSQSFVAGTFTLGGADAGEGATASLISGKIEYHGKERKFDAFVGCLGKNKEGKLESPGAGFPVSLDEQSGSVICTTWKPRNTSLGWDKSLGLSHKHTNRPAGHYLVTVKIDDTLYDAKWVELKDDAAKVTADLSIDPAKLGTLEVNIIGQVDQVAFLSCVPLDSKGELPLPEVLDGLGPLHPKIENGKPVKFELREGKYQLWHFRAKATAEVKAGATTKVDLVVPPPNAVTSSVTATLRLQPATAWKPLDILQQSSKGGATLKKLDDGSLLASGTNADKDTYVVVGKSELKTITGLRLEVLKDNSLPGGGPGRLENGTFILTRVEASVAPVKSGTPRAIKLKTATADFTQQGHSVANLIDGQPGPGWAIWNNGTADRQVQFTFAEPFTLERGESLSITLKHESQWRGGNLGRFRLSVTSSSLLVSVNSDANDSARLPASVDLRSQFAQWKLPPRGQGERNTCSVFVTVGAFEFALSKRHERGMPLSVEYSNWACNQVIRNSTADRGQFFHDLLKGYDKHGLCRDELMPYEEKFQNTQPSDAARRDADATLRLGFKVHWIRPWSRNAGLTEKQFSEIRQTLANGWPVCAGSDHSRLLVGYADDAQQPGGGKFLTRDSGLGDYGEVTYDWVRQHVYDLFWVELADKEPK